MLITAVNSTLIKVFINPILMLNKRRLTGPQKDDLIVQRQLGEVRDPLGPFDQGEELFVSRLTDVCHWIVGLQGDVQADTISEFRKSRKVLQRKTCHVFVSRLRVCFGQGPGVTLKHQSACSSLCERSAVNYILERGARRKTKQTLFLPWLEEEIPAQSCR